MKSYTLRKMTRKDLKITWKARNHDSIRATTVSGSWISWDQHCRWVTSRASGLKLLFTENKRPIGFVGLDRDSYWSFYLFPRDQGRGLSRIMLSLALIELKKFTHTIKARVLLGNWVSLDLHSDLHFERGELAVGYNNYIKELI